MARRTFFLLSLVVLFAGGVFAAAQTASGADGIAHVTLGQSAVPLCGLWKFTVGGSPIDPKTEPDFDDSKWEMVDLTPKDGASNPVKGTSGYVAGWTANGHPGYFGYAWYRIRMQVLTQLGQALPGEALALVGDALTPQRYARPRDKATPSFSDACSGRATTSVLD